MANTRNFGWRKLASMGLSGAVAATLFGFSGIPLDTVFAQTNDPFAHFAHPRGGDSIRSGDVVRVVTNTMFAEPPADARLESSEDSGVTWVALEDVVTRGRVVMGVYRPTAAQGVVVKFRTDSVTDPWFRSAIEVFVD